MNSVVILSPSKYSSYTICVAELLRRNNIEIKAIIVRKMLNPSRFFSEFKRDGSRLLRKILNKLILKKLTNNNTSFETIKSFCKKENININSVDWFKKHFNIPVLYCNTLNDIPVIKTLTKLKPNIVVFTGGGIIRDGVLTNSGAGVLNCHMGILPQYRGMDVVEWPILESHENQTGVTVHFMDKGIDTGDILKTTHIFKNKSEDIKQFRQRFEPIMCREMVSACTKYLNGVLQRLPQKQSDGRQYFIMHPILTGIVRNIIQK